MNTLHVIALGLIAFAAVLIVARDVFHFRAWNVHCIKTNPNACWRSDRREIGGLYADMGEVQLLNKIEDFCLMVLRVRYRREVRVRLCDEARDTVFATRVWFPRHDLTFAERLTKRIVVSRVYDNGSFIGVASGNRFMTPAKNILDGVYEIPEKSARYVSNVIPEMIVLPADTATGARVRKAMRERQKADREFVERHFRRAAWSYFLAYGNCVPMSTFFHKTRYSAQCHGMVAC